MNLRMTAYQLTTFAAVSALTLATAFAGDLPSVDRTILKEPAYRTAQPKYCLAVFGTNAQTRVWLILDGDTLFIDRNGNLDLTETGENVKGRSRPQGQRELEFNAETITAKEGVPPKTRLEVVAVPGLTFVYCHSEGQPWQRAVVDGEGYLAFSEKPQSAPVLHFQGPLTIGLRFDHPFKRHGSLEHLDIMMGTPGVGHGSFGRFGNQGVAKNLHPGVEIEFPGANGRSIKVKTVLEKRC